MNVLPVCLLYTQDTALARRIDGALTHLAELRLVGDASRLETALQPLDPAILLFDLCGDDAPALLARLVDEFPETVVVALGMVRSEPFLAAERMGVFAVEDYGVEGRRLHRLVLQAHAHQLLLHERGMLRQRVAAGVKEAATRLPTEAAPRPLPLARVFRHFGSLQQVYESIVEGVAEFAKVSRAGLFAIGRDEAVYRLRAGVKCLPETGSVTVPPEASLVRWFHIHAHLMARDTLARITDPAEYMLLKQALDGLGAEVIVPLHGRNRLIGWVFMGHRATGVPLDETELEHLARLGEDVSLTLDNALLYEEVAVQKTLAETVLHSIPSGIVAVDSSNTVHWFNDTAGRILETSASNVLHQSALRVDSRLADLLARCLKGETPPEPCEWVHPLNQRILSTVTRRLTQGAECLGAVAIIHDMTQERRLRKNQDDMERATFWTELAAAISHEVRNPLVAISTFAQLLPERYDDEEFRGQFSDLVGSEIRRLDHMVDQINAFANPPALTFETLAPAAIVNDAIEAARRQMPADRVKIEAEIPKGLPMFQGDRVALTDCFMHLIMNAVEAVAKTPAPVVRIEATTGGKPGAGVSVRVRVADNGGGIPGDIKDKVFSPFCSTKARGIGLGLPIVQRTVADHGGSISIDSGKQGTIVTVILPAESRRASNGEKDDETCPGG